MNEDIIQHQIKLIGFKVANFNFKAIPNPDKTDSPSKKFNLNLDNMLFKDSPNHFIKVFKVDLNFEGPDKEEIYDLTLEYHTVFECSMSITEDFLNSDFVKISAPAIGFPYLRAFISTLSVQGGLPPIILPSINFIQFSKETEKQKKGN
jgi:preprotein translocase subunit SecB